MSTHNADLKGLQGHIIKHGSSPCVQQIDDMITIQDSPGRDRLCAIANPVYYEKCLENMFHMVVECNSRISVQGLDTAAAEVEYSKTKPGENFAETRTNEARAWAQLCRVHGNARPKTDYNRIEFLLALCEQYQGHSKTKRALLKELHKEGTCLTNALFNVAVPIMETAAKFEDELNAQMSAGKLSTAAVNTVCADVKREAHKDKVGARKGLETCKICDKPGHNARDCLQFMLREGTCGHWFMHSIGIYNTGCSYGRTCKKKHDRPNFEPPENEVVTAAGSATRVSSMAAGAVPETNGGKPVMQELPVSELKTKEFTIMPNETNYWLNSNKIWMQPKDEDDSLCQTCETEHSQITPCSSGGQHSLLGHQMACALAVSAVEPDKPFRWASYSSQELATSGAAQSMSVLVAGTRTGVRSPPIFMDRAARKDTRFCYSVKAKK